jgi:hypothetical protein
MGRLPCTPGHKAGFLRLVLYACCCGAILTAALPMAAAADKQANGLAGARTFHVEEATIADIQSAILRKQITAVELVNLYLARIKAYNGPGVEEPEGILGPIKPVPHAKGINALARRRWNSGLCRLTDRRPARMRLRARGASSPPHRRRRP